MKGAVFSHSGLGDGLISLVLSNNFHQNGWEVDTYHNGLNLLQPWFSHLPIKGYPSEEQVPEILATYEKIIVFFDDDNPFIHQLIEEGKKDNPDQIKVIYPIPSKGVIHKPYYQDSLLDPKIPLVDNLQAFCKEILLFPKTTKKNGLIPPRNLHFRKFPKRVVFHISSSRPGKNWPIEKYVKLALQLTNQSYQVVFIAGGPEKRHAYLWLEKMGLTLPYFETLEEIAAYIYESGYLIGNDSGLAHLASSMDIPTVTISRRKAVAKFWRPGWSLSSLVVPSKWIINAAGIRLRDRYWQKFISVKKVKRAFYKLLKKERSRKEK